MNKKKDKHFSQKYAPDKDTTSVTTTTEDHNTGVEKSAKEKKRTVLHIVLGVSGFTVFVILVGLIAFFSVLQNLEKVNVPELREKHVIDALVSLQERGLIAQVQLRYHFDPLLTHHVLTQQPKAGSVVRIGRRVTLFVSKGVIIEAIKDYIGRDIGEVKNEILRDYATYEESVKLESVVYIFSDQSAGTILSQTPAPNSEASGKVGFSFVVSKGEEFRDITIGDYVGMNIFTALSSLSLNGVPFQFQQIESETSDGLVQSQSPSPGTAYIPGLQVTVAVNPPNQTEQVFGLFEVEMPLLPAQLPVRLVAVSEDDLTEELFTMSFFGGALTIPYLVDEGTRLQFFQGNELIQTQVVTR